MNAEPQPLTAEELAEYRRDETVAMDCYRLLATIDERDERLRLWEEWYRAELNCEAHKHLLSQPAPAPHAITNPTLEDRAKWIHDHANCGSDCPVDWMATAVCKAMLSALIAEKERSA